MIQVDAAFANGIKCLIGNTTCNHFVVEMVVAHMFTPLIEVCGDCVGTGRKDDIYTRTCSLCNGSGRVVKKKTVVIDIKPYKD